MGDVVVIVGSCSMLMSCLYIIATPFPVFDDGCDILQWGM